MKTLAATLEQKWAWLASWPGWLVDLAVIAAICGAILGFIAFVAGFSTYIERKVAGWIQARIGPNRVGPWGLLQFVADGIKLILKDDIIPAAADSVLFRLAPYAIFAASFAVFIAFPLTGIWDPVVGQIVSFGVANLNIGLIYIFAMGSLVVIGILMAGWASGNKWALFGAMRSAAQIVSYEIPGGISLLLIAVVAGSMRMGDVVSSQVEADNLLGFLPHVGKLLGTTTDGMLGWFAFRYPIFGLLAFFVYLVAGIAETNRTPFDIPEAESELVAGYHTEYSGIRWSFFFLAEYMNMFAVGAIGSTLFLGGWLPPYPGFVLSGSWQILEGLFWFVAKAYSVVLLMMWLRWTLPRFRVDQLMYFGWKVLLPCSFVNLFGASVWLSLASVT